MVLPLPSRLTWPTLPIIIGVFALIGWAWDIDLLKRGLFAGVAMSPAAAVGVIVLAVDVLRWYDVNMLPLINRVCCWATVIVLIGSAMELSDFAWATSSPIDRQFFPAKPVLAADRPGGMAPNTAFCLFTLGWTLLFLRKQSDFAIRLAQMLAVIPAFIALMAVIGYLYGVKPFYQIGTFMPMAIDTAVSLLFLAGAVILAVPDRGYLRVFSAAGYSGSISGLLLPAVVFVPVVLGLIALIGQHAGFYDRDFALALSVILNIAVLFLLTYFSAWRLFLSNQHQQAAETGLRESEQRYRSLVENAPLCIHELDMEGRFTAVNRAGLLMMDVNEQNPVLGYSYLDIVDASSRDNVQALLEQAYSGQISHFEFRGCGASAQVFKSCFVPIKNSEGRVTKLMGMTEDITERKLSEQSLRNIEELFRVSQFYGGIGVWENDLVNNRQYWSETVTSLLGFPDARKPAWENFISAVYPEDRNPVTAAHQAHIQDGKPYDVDYRMVGQDGKIRWMRSAGQAERDANGKPVRMLGIVQDITERKLAENDLRIAATAFESQEGMLVTDAKGVILRVNRTFTKVTGYSAEEAIGKNPRILSSGRKSPAFYASMWESINHTGSWEGEIWNRRKNGEVYPEYLIITAVKDKNGVVTHCVGSFTDITVSKAAADEIKHLAFYDPLTQLPNRRLLQDRLQQALTASARSKMHGALLFIDLDNFKTLNDTLGHDKGDLLLQLVAGRLTAAVRECDTVARLGGDEFVIMLEDLTEGYHEAVIQSETVGEKVLASLNQPYQLSGHLHRSTPSIGVTLFSDHIKSIDELLKQADIAMYQAKSSGRNTLCFFEPFMQAEIATRTNLEADLNQALQDRQFLLHYQPQMNEEGRITGAEALVRWQHPLRGLMLPVEFIRLAEETGLIVPLGLWVLETACRQLTNWAARKETAHLTLSVNVSARQFQQADFVERVSAVLDRTGVNPYKLKLELTESLLVSNVEDTIAKMTALKAKGVSFSLDDFGTGYSSLSYLKQLPLDQLKIDQGFIRDILIDANDAAIAKMVVALAESMGLAVIAEGVEDEAQREFLDHHGCHAYQGYLFSCPLSLEAFEAFLKREDACASVLSVQGESG